MATTLVQSNSSKPAGTPGTVQLTSTVTSGNLLLLGINWGNNAGTYTISDDASNTWHQFPNVATGIVGLNDLNAYWAIAGSSPATLTVTVTVTGGGAHGMRLAVYEYSTTTGWGTTPIDVGNSNSTTTGTASGNPGNITPTNTGELLVSFIQFANTTSGDTVASPFTEQPTSGGTAGTGWRSDGRADGADNTNSGNTSVTASWTWTSSVGYSALIAAFAPAAGGGGAMTGGATGAASVSGTLAGAGALNASITGITSLSATLAGAGDLAGSIAGAAAVSGTLAGDGFLGDSIAGAASVSGTLLGAGALAANILGHASVSGTPSGGAITQLTMLYAGVANNVVQNMGFGIDN